MSELIATQKEGVLIIRFTVSRIMSGVDVARIGERLANLAHSEGKKVLLDFANLQQMCSPMLGKILALNKECEQNGITLRLCGMESHIKEVFTTTGLNKLLKIHDTQEEALAAFRKKGWFW
ncbi:MAG: STAS domain-containing protein [Pirellulaceae bacterium]|nr:STAS domain-containing protein [Pirellulaceae bacterium]